MSKKSAGILVYSRRKGILEVLLVHPGPTPYFKHGDERCWSIPKGEFANEEPFEAALREFKEEVGIDLFFEKYIELTPVVQKSGKIVYAFAIEHDIDVSMFVSNNFEIEYPKNSGKMIELPEVDKVEWFSCDIAKTKLNIAQSAFVDELILKLKI